MGITNFPGFGNGTYCLVLSKSFTTALKEKIYCLKHFSLSYINKDGSLKSKFWKDLSTYEHVEHLALEKHKSDIQMTKKAQWPDMVSNKRGWIEMLIYNKITINNIEELRIEKELYNYNEKLLKQPHNTMNITSEYFAELYREIKKLCSTYKIPVKSTQK